MIKIMSKSVLASRPDQELNTASFETSPLIEINPTASTKWRLLVVIPADVEDEQVLLATRILKLTKPRGLQVYLIGICREIQEEAELKRKLILLAALLRDAHLLTEISIESGPNWLEKVKAVCGPNDLVACYSESSPRLNRKPLSDLLTIALERPVYVFHPMSFPKLTTAERIAESLAWLRSILVLVGFLILQIKLVQMPNNWVNSSLLYLSLFLEVGLLWVLNRPTF